MRKNNKETSYYFKHKVKKDVQLEVIRFDHLYLPEEKRWSGKGCFLKGEEVEASNYPRYLITEDIFKSLDELNFNYIMAVKYE